MQRAFCECGYFYVIEKGETLSGIAEKFGITREELLRMNPYLNPVYYLPGQVIIVPQEIVEESVIYTVNRGEYLNDILRKFKMNIAELRIMNPHLDVFYIHEGEKICIKKGTCGDLNTQ